LRLAETTDATSAPTAGDAFGTVYTVSELAQNWQLCENTIRKLFQDRPGVFKLGDVNPRRKRSYVTLRIPRAVAEQVWRERAR
jgi:hypothetical protein